jgi:hypothetical protein
VTEEWRPIVGTEGLYDVSSLGRIRSWRGPEPRILNPSPNGDAKGNYLIFKTFVNGVCQGRRVHVEVCLAFHGGRPEWAQVVRHLDGNVGNNRATNLAWGTHKENVADIKRHGYRAWSKLSEDDVRAVRASTEVARVLAERYGVSIALIRGVRGGRNRADVV